MRYQNRKKEEMRGETFEWQQIYDDPTSWKDDVDRTEAIMDFVISEINLPPSEIAMANDTAKGIIGVSEMSSSMTRLFINKWR